MMSFAWVLRVLLLPALTNESTYVNETSGVPHRRIKGLTTTSEAECRYRCDLEDECLSYIYNSSNPASCCLLGEAISGARCAKNFTHAVKENVTNAWSISVNYTLDSCFTWDMIEPLTEEPQGRKGQVCRDPIITGSNASVPLISVVFANGSHGVFHNDVYYNFTYNTTEEAWNFQHLSKPLFLVKAAVCAYAGPEAAEGVGCACDALPRRNVTDDDPTMEPVTTGDAACSAGYKLKYNSTAMDNWDVVSKYCYVSLYCRAQMWVSAVNLTTYALYHDVLDAVCIQNSTC